MILEAILFGLGMGVGYVLGRRRRTYRFAWTPRAEYTAPISWTSTGEGVRVRYDVERR